LGPLSHITACHEDLISAFLSKFELEAAARVEKLAVISKDFTTSPAKRVKNDYRLTSEYLSDEDSESSFALHNMDLHIYENCDEIEDGSLHSNLGDLSYLNYDCQILKKRYSN
jgi:hypothetical protein